MNNDLISSCFVESDETPYNPDRIYIDKQLFEEGLCALVKGKLVFKFTGIVLAKGNFLIVFPKGYCIPKDPIVIKHHIRVLINVLDRYKKEKAKMDPIENILLNGIGPNNNISAAVWLIEDYLINGILNISRREYIINSNSGSINWSRTIKKTVPYISNNTPLYLDLVKNKYRRDHSHILSDIHRYVINKCFKSYGWLFENENEFSDIVELPCEKEIAIYILNNELQNTFVDREINLLLHLRGFLEGAEDISKQKIITYATPYFYSTWEKICRFLFTDQSLTNILPKPFWNINNNIKYTAQIPDIIFETSDTMSILDAKYYSIEKNLPGWPDLVKQFFYAHTLKQSILTEKRIENFFIFPSSNSRDLEYMGYAGIEDTPSLGKIKAFKLDVYKAMELYSNYDKGSIKEEFINFNEL